MSKKIYVKENNLIKIKNAMASENTSHSTFMSEDKPPYEKDEFTINPEGGANDFFHLGENTFEKWFDGSVLVDEDGKPIKMYHGTSKKFDSFSKDFINSSGAGAYEGYGFNFTPNWGTAAHYSTDGNIIEAYLSVKHPLKSTENTLSLNTVMKAIAEIDKGVPVTGRIVAAFEVPRYNENWDEVYYKRALRKAAQSIIEYNGEDYGNAGIYAGVCESGQGNPRKTIEVFEKLGYDSAIFYDDNGKIRTVIVFEPNQIKLVNNKTFTIDSDVMSENTNLIIESQESKSISAAKKLVMQKFGYDEQEADDFVRVKLRNDIPSLRTHEGGKFILGVTRMFCNGELRTASIFNELNSTLKLVSSDAHINEYDRNLNGLSAQGLIKKFSKAILDNIEAEKTEISQMVFDTPSQYEIVRIDSFEQASQYCNYVDWCVTHDERMFNSYTSNGINQFYFCLKNGFENVNEQPSDNCPLDEYGLSMIAVSVNENGMLNTCTCRWNHDNGGDDSIMNAKQISQTIGANFFNVFKPNNKWQELLNNTIHRLANGESPENVFNKCYYGFGDGIMFVEFNGRYNYISKETNEILSNQWFETIQFMESECENGENFKEIAMVKLNGKFNYISYDGNFLSEQWFDECYGFEEGFAIVELNGKFNFISDEGFLIGDQWFDDAYEFHNELADVSINDEWYKLDIKGNLHKNDNINENVVKRKILISENKLAVIKENIESEVEANQVKLDSFKKRDELVPKIWDGDKLNSRVRLKLLDIADDFWESTNIGWVKPKNIVLMGSICNYNWSKFSDIDLHLQVDFSEIDNKKDFVQEYFNGKKNEWNKEHSDLKIFDFPVELYVEDLGANTNSGGIYDLEQNDWVKKPSKESIKPIGLNKYSIKDKAAKIMTDIDDLYGDFKKTDDDAKLRKIGEKAHKILDYVKAMRKKGLDRGGESDSGNIIYKVLRRTGYMDILWKLSSKLYDKLNSINENTENNVDYFKLAKEFFGVTNDIRECGYVLPDGAMLDFSGRHSLNPGTDSSHLKGRRPVGHEEISNIGWSKDGNTKFFDINREDFIKLGAIRTGVYKNYCALNFTNKPTPKQISVILSMIRYADGNVDIDIIDGYNSLCYAEYEETNPRRVVNDIIRYFDEGIKLIGNVTESSILDIAEKYIRRNLNEEVVADGNADHNPFKQRWKHEREVLINYLLNYGELMTSKENGKQYRVLFDDMLSNRIGMNYCLCIQWNPLTMEPGNVIYVRAYDKFTKKIFKPEFDTRGFDNMAGTADDVITA